MPHRLVSNCINYELKFSDFDPGITRKPLIAYTWAIERKAYATMFNYYVSNA